jgi:hypothetical protein
MAIQQPDITLQRVYERLRKLEKEAADMAALLQVLEIDASQVTSGTLDEARLPASVAHEDEANIFTLNQLVQKTRPEWVLQGASGSEKFRTAAHAAGSMMVGRNVSYDGANWNLDDTALTGDLFSLADLMGYWHVTAGANPRVPAEKFKVNTTGQLFERGRTTAIGEYQSRAYNAANFTASGGGTFVPQNAGAVQVERWALVGKQMHYVVYVNPFSITGTPATIFISIPGGFTCANQAVGFFRGSNAGAAAAVGTMYVTTGGNTINFFPDVAGTTLWANAANTSYLQGHITFEVQ